MKKENYTLKEAAKFLNVSYRTILRLVKGSSLPVFRVGHRWRINRDDLAQYIRETKRRPSIGQWKVYFKMGVLNRYKKEAKYWFQEEEFSGRFGLRQQFWPEGPEASLMTREAISDVRFEKVVMKGGVMAVCLDNDYYRKSVGRIPDEYAHWHNYRIHFPQLENE
jgi:excisionase family DNA binding protein